MIKDYLEKQRLHLKWVHVNRWTHCFLFWFSYNLPNMAQICGNVYMTRVRVLDNTKNCSGRHVNWLESATAELLLSCSSNPQLVFTGTWRLDPTIYYHVKKNKLQLLDPPLRQNIDYWLIMRLKSPGFLKSSETLDFLYPKFLLCGVTMCLWFRRHQIQFSMIVLNMWKLITTTFVNWFMLIFYKFSMFPVKINLLTFTQRLLCVYESTETKEMWEILLK